LFGCSNFDVDGRNLSTKRAYHFNDSFHRTGLLMAS